MMNPSFEQVVQNIELLYSTPDPNQVQSIQQFLLTVQKQDNGDLARSLLQVDSTNCQYFGALTYSVLISTDRDMSPEKVHAIAKDLLQFIICGRFQTVIIKKLLSNYSLLFVANYQFYSTNPVEELLASLLNGPVLDLSALDESGFFIVINLCEIIVEELIKKEKASIHQVIHSQIHPYVESIFKHFANLELKDIPFEILSTSLSCLNSWITYISMAESQSEIRYTETDVFTSYLFRFLESLSFEDESLQLINQSISALTEVLEMNPTMIGTLQKKEYLKDLLFGKSKFGDRFINQMIFESYDMVEDETSNFINLVIAFLSREVLSLAKHLIEPGTRYIMEMMVKLTNFPGIAVIDETLSEQLLPFWEEFFNIFIDDEESLELFYSSDTNIASKQEFYNLRNELCLQVCMVYWNKIKLPTPENSTSNQSGFFFFKANVGDFFSSVYSLLKLPFYKDLTRMALKTIQSNDLLELESTLYILYKINDDSTFYESQSNILLPHVNELMTNGFLEVCKGINPDTRNYFYVASTIIRFISSVEFYFKADGDGPQYLGSVLDFLFSMIIQSDNSKLSLFSSKTILSICQECRNHLVVFLPNLKSLLDEMVQNDTIDDLIRSRMTNAYVSILQSAYLKDPQSFSGNLSDILININAKANQLMNKPLDEHSEEYLISLLSCVNEVGKATILPEEADDLFTEQENWMVSEFWDNDKDQVKGLVLSIIQTFSLDFSPFVTKPSITEICCQILKCGLNEPINGPFKFSLSEIFGYLTIKIQSCDPGSIYHLFKLIESIIITNYKSLDEQMIRQLLTDVIIPYFRSNADDDPDIVSSSIDIFTSMLDKKPSLLLNSDYGTFKEILQYNTVLLQATDALTIKSLMKFWNSFIQSRKGNESDHRTVQQVLVEENFGHQFLQQLMSSFIKNSRSFLDHYYPVFRVLVSRYQLHCRNWMADCLAELNSKHITDTDKKQFMDKLFLTRGQRSANDILKNFWLQTNGLIEFNTRKY